jgi:hypothetical protein
VRGGGGGGGRGFVFVTATDRLILRVCKHQEETTLRAAVVAMVCS